VPTWTFVVKAKSAATAHRSPPEAYQTLCLLNLTSVSRQQKFFSPTKNIKKLFLGLQSRWISIHKTTTVFFTGLLVS
jgi:hypothetical protein